MLGFLGNPSKTCHRNCCESHLQRETVRSKIDTIGGAEGNGEVYGTTATTSDVEPQSFDRSSVSWRSEKMFFFCTGTGTPPVVEVNTVKARYVFFMLCQKREGKDILVVNGIVRKWYTKMSCTGLIG